MMILYDMIRCDMILYYITVYIMLYFITYFTLDNDNASRIGRTLISS